MLGYQLGRCVGTLLVPAMVPLFIGLFYYFRTRDTDEARRMALSWWSLVLFFSCFVFSLLAQAVQTLTQ
ncbi:MAG: hypothetical protein QNJ45_14540 [Ardenticatenaceae bacterium]|nr:hypothetical protein [Ardenticatenaceae bacterium]